jgi:hypothetical protein
VETAVLVAAAVLLFQEQAVRALLDKVTTEQTVIQTLRFMAVAAVALVKPVIRTH